jgi:hypothetical protein
VCTCTCFLLFLWALLSISTAIAPSHKAGFTLLYHAIHQDTTLRRKANCMIKKKEGDTAYYIYIIFLRRFVIIVTISNMLMCVGFGQCDLLVISLSLISQGLSRQWSCCGCSFGFSEERERSIKSVHVGGCVPLSLVASVLSARSFGATLVIFFFLFSHCVFILRLFFFCCVSLCVVLCCLVLRFLPRFFPLFICLFSFFRCVRVELPEDEKGQERRREVWRVAQLFFF